MSVIDTLRQVVDTSELLMEAEEYLDQDLAMQCVCIRLLFSSGQEVYVFAEGTDDSVVVRSKRPDYLSDAAICPAAATNQWSLAIGRPLLWAWAMTNTQGRVDGVQVEFGTVDQPGLTLQVVVRASTLRTGVLLHHS